ncbi:hypothetical protein CLPU_22c00080 [Gottschalkia purinilytica]|uniref:Uncharacterized protein n=1 Tax=Gottschalkia purinilytica TaxID=1503 RepID=A0A0L0W6R6_GOTPU|nr:hypothetical protein [Gottschalkia purinilytica]KNF07156.1 hypothetical protein CLPU_22c00080 [Gottschalkia purinilytica]
MANDVSVKPTPIQRNELDVAMELTQFHFKRFGVDNAEHMKQIFTEYYSLVQYLELIRFNEIDKLKEFLPEDIRKALE